MKLYSMLLLLLFPLVHNAQSEHQQIKQRIMPVGKVHIQEENNGFQIEHQKTKMTAKRGIGKQIYEKHCIICHRDGLAGAPKFRNKNDWSPRLSGKTRADLLNSAIKGLNAMPAKGTCSECTKAELNAAIYYMMPHHD